MLFKESGITLIELIVVITVLGVLLSVAVPNMIKAVERSRDIAREINSKLLISIIQTYNNEQLNHIRQVRGVQILHRDDIQPVELRERIPADFDWTMIYPIYIDHSGRGSIRYDE